MVYFCINGGAGERWGLDNVEVTTLHDKGSSSAPLAKGDRVLFLRDALDAPADIFALARGTKEPVRITEQNKADLTACAENILLAREAHFPATIADLYDPATMPDNLRRAHALNDELLEGIYIGRRFKNDTERLEKLFALYTKMTATPAAPATPAKKIRRSKQA